MKLSLAAALVILVTTVLAGCTPARASALTECEDVMRTADVADVLGESTLVQVHSAEPDAVSPLLDEMASNGVACGIDESTSPVFIGQLSMDESRWSSTRDEFASDGYDVDLGYPLPDAVTMSDPSEDIALAGAFAWHSGVLFYGKPGIVLQLLPALKG